MADPTLLIAWHSRTGASEAMAHAAANGAGDAVRLLAAHEVMPEDLLEAGGYLFVCPENLATMSGMMKDMFDRCYNDWLEQKEGLPVGIYIRAGLDGTATRRALEGIAGAQRWRLVAPPLILHGAWLEDYPAQVEELAMGMAAGLDAGIF